MQLVIGNKNYSSWSLRAWLLLSAFRVDFAEIQESLLHDTKQRLGKYSPSGKVPVLIDGDVTIWDSLAICEYVSENYLAGRGWPENKKLRAEARAISAEMHSGFVPLRNELPMNCRASRKVKLSIAAQADIAYIDAIWSNCLKQNAHLGPWLFGEFSIADCFFAPVASRFSTYGIALSESAQNYVTQVLGHQSLVAWTEAAKAETEVIPQDEAGE